MVVERSQNIIGFVGSADCFAVYYSTYDSAFHVNVSRIGGIGEQRLANVALFAVVVGLPRVSVG